eukprot:3327232-Amphidinium_carterae.1
MLWHPFSGIISMLTSSALRKSNFAVTFFCADFSISCFGDWRQIIKYALSVSAMTLPTLFHLLCWNLAIACLTVECTFHGFCSPSA